MTNISEKWYKDNKNTLSDYYKKKYVPIPNKLKICKVCNNNFETNKTIKIYCSKECQETKKKEINKISEKQRNKTLKRKLYLKNYYKSEKGKLILKKYYTSIKGKKSQLKYKKKKYKEDIIFNLSHKIRVRISHLLRKNNYHKEYKSLEFLGCSIPKLKEHLENQFTLGMSWKNYGWGWHIDHIIPLCSATTKEELYKLFDYTNLQPLWKLDNLKKGNKNYKD